MNKWVLAVTIALAAPAAASAQDLEAGKAQFNKCKACHMVGEGAKNGLGPSLTGVIGRKAGTSEGFAYSDAVKKAGEGGLVWDEAKLTEWVQHDDKVIAGNKMIFPGIKDPAEAANVVAYLKSAGGAGAAAAPAAAAPAAEAPAAPAPAAAAPAAEAPAAAAPAAAPAAPAPAPEAK